MKFPLICAFAFYSMNALCNDVAHFDHFNLQVNLGMSHETLNSKKSSSTEDSSESFNQIEMRPQLTYFFTNDLAAGVYYFQKSLLADFNSSGIGAFLRYYYLGKGSVLKSKLDNKKINQSPVWAPYVQLGGKRETLEAETVSISFTGFDLAAGVDWHWSKDYFLNFSASMSTQTSGATRDLSSQTFLIGIGKALSF
jgi:hypothetical protein